jgi:hypothetical protein
MKFMVVLALGSRVTSEFACASYTLSARMTQFPIRDNLTHHDAHADSVEHVRHDEKREGATETHQ